MITEDLIYKHPSISITNETSIPHLGNEKEEIEFLRALCQILHNYRSVNIK
jgi:hypothetical protein